MKINTSQKSGMIGLRSWVFASCMSMLVLALASPADAQTQTRNGSVLGWNNLGMHCADGDFSVFSILPPYNTVISQVIDVNGNLITNQSGVGVTYMAVADPNGSINKTSDGKTNFWDHVQSLFGVSLAVDVGLPVPGPNSFSMPGAANAPKSMAYEQTYDWTIAYGIPIVATDDAGNINNYPLMRLTGKNGSTVIATRDVVLPVSTEINCNACHGSGSSPNAQPADGWVNLPEVERDFRLNVLRLHDDRQLGTPAFATALANANMDPAGLYATVVAGNKAILCASCHLSEALPGSGQGTIPPLTTSVHATHSKVMDPANGLTLDSASNRTSCYYCHPGKETKCLRGVMGRAVAANGQLSIQCQSCHGPMSLVGSASRTGWMDEPTCQACHTGDAVTNAGQIRYNSVFSSGTTTRTVTNQRFATNPNAPSSGFSLYRYSRGHGGLYCQACHNSTHAEFPSIDDNDNIMSMQQQGYIGPIAECQSCHGTAPNTTNGGPHGLHPIGQSWVSAHKNNSGSACRVCHGTDYRGTVLSRARTDRTLSASGTKTFWRGFQIGCYNCHNGPNGDSGSNTPAVVKNLTATTTAGKSVAITLQATDANNNPMTLRIVSQPGNGTAGLSGSVVTYFPDAGFSGNDMMTYAAWDGSTDSNLGTINISVTGGGGAAYTITPANASLGAGASSGTVAVGTTSGSQWTAVSNAPWITITSGASGTGSGTVAYSASANTGTAVRSGTMTIAGQSFIVNQASSGTACTYAINPATASYNSTAHTGTVAVSTTAGCAWTASSGATWITITSGANSTGSGTVAYGIAANTTNASRTGTMTIAGQQFTVTQDASAVACVYALTPAGSSVDATAHTGTVAVGTTAGCAWTATSGVNWITVNSGVSGSGPGNVSYNIAANTGTAARTGTLTIAGKAFTVTQAAPAVACLYTLTPASLSVNASARTGTIAVGTTPTCKWTATSGVPWITITSGASGTGSGKVAYRIAANTTTVGRTGTLTIADKSFAVNQAGVGCTYSINPVSASLGASSGKGSLAVTTGEGCTWTVVDKISWLTVTSGATGTGSGNVEYSYTENTGSSSRTGTLTVAGKTFSVTQVGSASKYTINPISAKVSSRGTEGSVAVSAGRDSRWSAKSNVRWIEITSGFTGKGNGTVKYKVSRNESSRSRTGTLTIAGLTFTVSQSSGSSREESSIGVGSEFGTVALNTNPARQLLSAELIVQNSGKEAISKVPAVYLSDNGVKNASDTLLWKQPVKDIAPGESVTRKFTISLPEGVNGKGKYLVAMTGDSENDAVVYGPIE
ncbi:MAG TPA: hypothetical protein DET40_17190 [Lentisphaeria bacterium]|nr:MAG: hypothetical protein A2X45_02815 [Lentisphaerae bacterium GWF2_50_93]HCE45277.1 hypothetical protein [Lentisphaeria bacterium]